MLIGEIAFDIRRDPARGSPRICRGYERIYSSRMAHRVGDVTVKTTGPIADADHLSLVVVGDGVLATSALPSVGAVIIGRAADCDVRIDDQSISRNHAMLVLDPPLRVVDQNSANGTWVQNHRVPPGNAVEIRVDEAFRLGSVTAIVQRRRAPPARARRLRTHEYFESRLEDECARAQRHGLHFVVAHVALADPADVETALARCLADVDIVAAYAPGELELLLVDTEPARGTAVLEAIEAALAARDIAARVGTAWYPRDGRDPSALAARARGRAFGQVAVVPDTGDIVVADEKMRSLHALVARVAAANISVLLQGETGVGKEVVAELIHRGSARAGKPFLKLNCAALTETLLESELFGHERGAFTGAIATKPGLLEVADGGVLFLDEVGELAQSTQAKLLRVLDERKLLRVGGTAPRAIDVRIVSATNRDLETEVQRGAFRLDLLYRLNALSIVIPPLRERAGEIIPLAKRFLVDVAAKHGRPVPRLSEDAAALMRAYTWPGNVRELRNVVERALVLATSDVIDVHDLPHDKMRATLVAPPAAELPTASRPHDGDERVAVDERQQILDALDACGGNQTHAARLLGVSRRTLINRLEKFALPRPRKR
jgi:DNA-binding NtrC family response regulator